VALDVPAGVGVEGADVDALEDVEQVGLVDRRGERQPVVGRGDARWCHPLDP
jgi:hypothetical protein